MKLKDYIGLLQNGYNAKVIDFKDVNKYWARPDMFGDNPTIEYITGGKIKSDLFVTLIVEGSAVDPEGHYVAGAKANVVFVEYDNNGNVCNHYLVSCMLYKNDHLGCKFIRLLESYTLPTKLMKLKDYIGLLQSEYGAKIIDFKDLKKYLSRPYMFRGTMDIRKVSMGEIDSDLFVTLIIEGKAVDPECYFDWGTKAIIVLVEYDEEQNVVYVDYISSMAGDNVLLWRRFLKIIHCYKFFDNQTTLKDYIEML